MHALSAGVLLLAACAAPTAQAFFGTAGAVFRPGALRSATPLQMSLDTTPDRPVKSLAARAVTLFSALSFVSVVAPQESRAFLQASDASQVAELCGPVRREAAVSTAQSGHEMQSGSQGSARGRVAFAVGNDLYSPVLVAEAAVEEAPTAGVKGIFQDPQKMATVATAVSAGALFVVIKGSPKDMSKGTKKAQTQVPVVPATEEDPATMLLRMKKEEMASAVSSKMSSAGTSMSQTIGNRPSTFIMGTSTTLRIETPESETRFAGFDGKVVMGRRPPGYETVTLMNVQRQAENPAPSVPDEEEQTKNK